LAKRAVLLIERSGGGENKAKGGSKSPIFGFSGKIHLGRNVRARRKKKEGSKGVVFTSKKGESRGHRKWGEGGKESYIF